MAELSPMMQQYLEIKKQHKDEILFYRIGDFYEMFFDDALTASRELDLTLTGKQCGLEERAPMCGVPFHSYEGYVARLISKGYKVAICEQVEDPAKAKGLVKHQKIALFSRQYLFCIIQPLADIDLLHHSIETSHLGLDGSPLVQLADDGIFPGLNIIIEFGDLVLDSFQVGLCHGCRLCDLLYLSIRILFIG